MKYNFNIPTMIKKLFHVIFILGSLFIFWLLINQYSGIPTYLLPSPIDVFKALHNNEKLLIQATNITLEETLLGLLLGCLLGGLLAFFMCFIPIIKYWFIPIIVISQSIPTFALAPLLVLWFGFGIKSKIIMTILMVFFPVTSNFFDGLNRTPPEWLELGQIMNASTFRQILYLRIPAALPSFASGIRIASVLAPIGAIVGEWVGASSGLGFLMQNANNRFQTDLMFAALFILSLMTITLWGSVTFLTKKLIPWEDESLY